MEHPGESGYSVFPRLPTESRPFHTECQDLSIQQKKYQVLGSEILARPDAELDIRLSQPGFVESDLLCYILRNHPTVFDLLRATMAKIWEYFAQAFPPKPTFEIEDIPDLSNKVIVVTGMSRHQKLNISCHVF